MSKEHNPLSNMDNQLSGLFRMYKTEIANTPAYLKKKQIDLWKSAQAGDVFARRNLSASCTRLVASITYPYRYSPVQLLDLIQDGNEAVLQNMSRFKPNRGMKFTSYIFYPVKKAVSKTAWETKDPIRIPQALAKQVAKVRTAKTNCLLDGKAATKDNIAQEASITPNQVVYAQQHDFRFLSMDRLIRTDERGMLTGEVWEDKTSHDPQEESDLNQLKSSIEQVFRTVLTAQEARVLYMRFGILDGVAQSRQDVASKMAYKPQRIQQIEKKALEKLRNSNEGKQLMHFLSG